MTVRVIWFTWFLASMAWFAGSVWYISNGGGLGIERLVPTEPSLLSPQLARPDCSPMIDPLSRGACEGATAMARARRLAGDVEDDSGQALAGTLVVAPPLAALVVVIVLVHTVERREARRRGR
ncbi:MAG: hypothetical protein H6843_16950 [Rhodospirillaceae bacterium]|nr:hypothetical protein [Rhodospirillaceae bacterium]